MNDTAITVKSVTKKWGDTKALDGFSLEMPAGSVFAIVGPDGAGKTTLLRILAGILDCDTGEVEFFGKVRTKSSTESGATIGYMPQRFGLYEDLTVQENIDFFADLFSVRGTERKERIKRLLTFSRMEPFTDRLAGQLSGGMKQKLGLACALIHSPQILLLDEPTNGVDPVSRREFWRLLFDLNRGGTTIIISSPYMDEAERASRFALMSKGKLIAHGIPSEERQQFPFLVYELSSDRARDVKDLLRKVPEFKSVNLFGRSVHIVTDRATGLENLRAVLSNAQVDSSSLRTILPTFEDIYIGLTQE